MDIKDYLNNMNEIYTNILNFIDNEDKDEENYKNLLQLFSDHKIDERKQEIKSILYIILAVSNNHYRSTQFFLKIEQLLLFFKAAILKNFTSFDIFSIYEENNRVLLLLIENEILKIDEKIAISIFENHGKYFSPEVKPFIQNEEKKKQILFNLPENFEEKRRIGENDDFICNLIRSDLIDDFISFVNHENFSLNSLIKPSIYETNQLLKNNKYITLIEYASFFGSIQIFKYLYLNKVELNSSVWIFAIHSDNPELINFLEECKIEPEDSSFKECLLEAIKCNHNDMANYIINNLYIEKESVNNYIFDDFQNNSKNIFKQSSIFSRSNSDNYNNVNNEHDVKNDRKVIEAAFNNYNYAFFPNDFKSNYILFSLCSNDYFTLIELLLKIKKLDLNLRIIQRKNYFYLIDNVTALYLAAEKNHIEIVQLLLSQPGIEIGSNAFKQCSKLTQISLPSSVKKIENNEFCECSSLSQITIPSSVTKIGDNTFRRCKSLSNITIPSIVTSIGRNAFNGCSKLTKISLPSSLTEIGCYAFCECTSLIQIEIPSSVIKIDGCAFKDCLSLTQIKNLSKISIIEFNLFNLCSSLSEITIPDSVTKIGNFSFCGCSSLSEIEIPPSVIEIGENAFKDCSSLKNVSIPSSVTKMGPFIFCGCSSLQKISLSNSIKEIKLFSFYGCKSLKQIKIPSSVTSIENCAFKGCSALQQISLQSSQTSIGTDVFIGCTSLTQVFIHSSISSFAKNAFPSNIVLISDSKD